MQDLAPEENHVKACNYIRQAAAQGAELAVLPEYVHHLKYLIMILLRIRREDLLLSFIQLFPFLLPDESN